MTNRIKCNVCSWHGIMDDRLLATNPFAKNQTTFGCPECKATYGFEDIRDEKDGWVEVATERFVERDSQSIILRTTDFTLHERAGRWQVEAIMKLDADIRSIEKETMGRGDSPHQACNAIRPNVFEWVEEAAKADNFYTGEYDTALRQLCYAAEDAKYEEGKAIERACKAEWSAVLGKGTFDMEATGTTSAAWKAMERGYAAAQLDRKVASEPRTVRQVEVYSEIPMGKNTRRWYSCVHFSDGTREDDASPLNYDVGIGRVVSVEDIFHEVAAVVIKHGCTVKPGEIKAFNEFGSWQPAGKAVSDTEPRTVRQVKVYYALPMGDSTHRWQSCVDFSDGTVEYGAAPLNGVASDEAISRAVTVVAIKHGCTVKPGEITVGISFGTWEPEVEVEEVKEKEDPAPEVVTLERAEIYLKGAWTPESPNSWEYCVSFSDRKRESGEWDLPITTPDDVGISAAVMSLVGRYSLSTPMRLTDITVLDDDFGTRGFWNAPKA